ncbi:short-chain dehydrogenase/reductase family 16C member 6-like isoform X2 [Microplitis mediator]|uniref:short-chain dehydrogenase/reductase family 16C member 6-like isoform X2 n=1 Tax=Microplitis mediator TaxID=375433 RepID=UPI002553F01C|nr:short-chain dehydrogenase/reductase family 16C member 6-like isoform X2 [Microplitis mediator]
MDFKEVLNILYDTLVFLWLSVVYITESFVLSLIPRKYRSKSIQGEVALVTGGAGGLGKLIALKLAALGTHVVIWDINKSGIKDVVDEIKSQGGKCTGYFCDISNKEEIYRVAKTVQVEVGNITIIVNNAGYVCGKTFMNLPDDEIEKTFKVNILSHYWINKSFMKEMMKENHGHIVTIASVAGLLGTYNCTDYSATKFAAIGYHESLLTELKVHGYHGINTTLVCPYFINTGMFPGVKPRLLPMLEPEYVADEVVAGILTNQINVTMPISTKYFLPLKSWLPPKLCWALMYNIIKGPQTMMMLQKNENMHNYDRINKY